MSQVELSVIVPMLNEEGNLPELARRIDRALALNRISYELILIDDNSSDNSYKVAESLAEYYPIYVFKKIGSRGKAQSILEGFSYATGSLIGFIDADLQYPPEALPGMVAKIINAECDVCVATRMEYKAGQIRNFITNTFSFFFTYLLHDLDFDVQAGLKVFRAKITREVRVKPTPWTFDLEFLLNARNIGYKIEGFPIRFDERTSGSSKVSLFKTSCEIGWNALKQRFKPRPPFYLPPDEGCRMSGAGIAHKGKRFITHSTLEARQMALETFTSGQKLFIAGLTALILSAIALHPLKTIMILITIVSLFYFFDSAFHLFLILRSLRRPPTLSFSKKSLDALDDDKLPVYSLLCPLYRESKVLPGFLEAIDKIDWPKEKLDVLLLLEADDTQTRETASSIELPSYIRIITVPDSFPKTKPKACNYGLEYAKGEYVVIYDAEDIPDPLQFKKAYLAFSRVPREVCCLQAKLNYHNPGQNLLTRLFTLEYSLWFDVILPAMQSIDTFIPLGGTSNHFRTEILRELRGWDPFNVTEDCDLGVRLFNKGYKTAIIDSTTYEEANSNYRNWLRQRSRWIKGYMQTYLVVMRRPVDFFRKDFLHAAVFQLVIGGKTAFLFINPLLWLTTLSYFLFRPALGGYIESIYLAPVYYLAVASLVFGNFTYLFDYMIGCAKRQKWELMKYAYLVPFYWLAMSRAALIAGYQLITRPHYWEKTEHGLNLMANQAVTPPEIKSFPPEINRPRKINLLKIPLALSVKRSLLRLWGFSKAFYRALAGNARFAKRTLIDLAGAFSGHIPELDKNSREQYSILIFNWRDKRHKFAGGAEEYIHEIARRWTDQGIAVTIFCGNDSLCPRSEIIDGISIVRRGGFYFVYLWALLYYIFRFRGRYDVIIDCQNGIPFFTPLYAREPVFCLMHHVHQDVFIKSLIKPLALIAGLLEKRAMPIVYKNIKFITVSRSSKRAIEKMGLGRQGIHIIYPGVNLKTLHPGEKCRYPLVLYLGRLKAYKSIDILIKAFKLVHDDIPDARLIVAGSGDEHEKLENLALEIGIEPYVDFTGRVSERDKVKLMQKAWIAVNPSLMEGWGITTIEANACGTPVVASDVPGLRDSVLSKRSGYLVPYGDINEFADKILLLAKDARLREMMGKKALDWSDRFKWDNSSSFFLSIIKVGLPAAKFDAQRLLDTKSLPQR